MVKPYTEFYYDNKNSTYRYDCKICHKIQVRYKKYNTTESEMLKLLKRQNKKCCICNSNISDKFVIDHNHKTKEIRGLLCNLCNMGLGKFRDRIDLLCNAVVFLHERGSYGNEHKKNHKG